MYSTAGKFLYQDYSSVCQDKPTDAPKLPVLLDVEIQGGKLIFPDKVTSKGVPKETFKVPETSLKELPLKELPKVPDSANPKIWGPYFWTQLHLAATYYPEDPSPVFRERIKQRILSIPYEVPCANCRNHALTFIELHKDKLDKIVSGKHALGMFYTDFHNYVNERYGKRKWTYPEVLAYYSNFKGI